MIISGFPGPLAVVIQALYTLQLLGQCCLSCFHESSKCLKIKMLFQRPHIPPSRRIITKSLQIGKEETAKARLFAGLPARKTGGKKSWKDGSLGPWLWSSLLESGINWDPFGGFPFVLALPTGEGDLWDQHIPWATTVPQCLCLATQEKA